MRCLIRPIAALFCAALLLGNTNCNKNSDSSAPQFVTSLSVQDINGNPSSAFAQGNPIKFVLSIRNRSNTAQTLFFNSSELANFVVVDAGSATVEWTCDGGSAAACVLTPGSLGVPSASGSGFFEIDLAAFQTVTLTATWDQTDDNGAQVPVVPANPGGSTVGKYEVFGGFTVYNTTGPGDAADNGNSMAVGPPTSDQMFPTVYRSTLQSFTIN